MFRRLSSRIVVRNANEITVKYKGIKNLTAFGLSGRTKMTTCLLASVLMLGLGMVIYTGVQCRTFERV